MQALTTQAWLRWDRVRRLLPPGESLLEIGAGMGGLGVMLSRHYDYTGLEPDETSYAVSARRNPGRVLNARAEDHDGVYDIVCAFEVLEHIEDDVEALASWRDRSRNWLLISVPSNPQKFGPADERVGHYRRYDRNTLSAALGAAGWEARELCAYGFPLGLALDAIRQRIAARRPLRDATTLDRTHSSGRWLQPPESLAALTWTAALPFRLLQRPFAATDLGSGLIALASRN